VPHLAQGARTSRRLRQSGRVGPRGPVGGADRGGARLSKGQPQDLTVDQRGPGAQMTGFPCDFFPRVPTTSRGPLPNPVRRCLRH
jgi:hypothetical protein